MSNIPKHLDKKTRPRVNVKDLECCLEDSIDESPEPEDSKGMHAVVKDGFVVATGLDGSVIRSDIGPSINDVNFCLCCGTCSKFVKIDDSIRSDPVWEVSMLKSKNRCPYLFISDYKIENQSDLASVVKTAESRVCSKYSVNLSHPNISQNFIDIYNSIVKSLTYGEVEIVGNQINEILAFKRKERRLGYRIGEIINIDDGIHVHKAKVISYSNKKNCEIIVKTIDNPGKQIKMAIPARKITVIDDGDI